MFRRCAITCSRRWRLAMLAWAAIVALACVSASAAAGETMAGPVAAEVLEVLDGDSFKASVQIWPGQRLTVSVRLRGVDAPEMRGRCVAERQLAERARDMAAMWIGAQPVMLANIGGGKYYGRVLADVRLGDGGDLAERLLGERLARPYGGKRREGWCG